MAKGGGLNDPWPSDADFKMGDFVAKKGRASWRGRIVGWYRTDLTALGYAIESYFEPGSVQIYPQAAIEAWTPFESTVASTRT